MAPPSKCTNTTMEYLSSLSLQSVKSSHSKRWKPSGSPHPQLQLRISMKAPIVNLLGVGQFHKWKPINKANINIEFTVSGWQLCAIFV